MNKTTTCFILFLLINSFQLFSQTDFKIEKSFLLFEDTATEEPVLMYNDSTMATGFHFTKTNIKTSFPKGLDKKEFNSYQFKIKKNTYLIDAGAGPVIQYQNNKFIRVDKSFRHRSQYQAVPFQKDNEIYLWGGYGLFSFKNILTKYNFKTQEWVDVAQKAENTIPPIQTTKTYVKTADKLYLFGGRTQNFKNIAIANYLDNSVWKLELKSNTWSITGKHNIDKFINDRTERTFIFERKNKTVLMKENLLEIDIDNNKIKLYSQKNYKSLRGLVYHKKTDNISYVYKKSNGTLVGVTEAFKDFKGELLMEDTFYAPKEIKNEFWALLVLSLLIGTWVIYKNQTKRNQSTLLKDQIIYKTDSNEFYFNTQLLDNLSHPKKEIIKILLTNRNRFIPLNELNNVITEDAKNESYGAIKKRREVLIKELQQELALLLAIDKETVFETQKNHLDRRIKEIKLTVNIRVE